MENLLKFQLKSLLEVILLKLSVVKKSQPISESCLQLKWKSITPLWLERSNHCSDHHNVPTLNNLLKLKIWLSSVHCVKKAEEEVLLLTLLKRQLWVKSLIWLPQEDNKNLHWENNLIDSSSLLQLLPSFWVLHFSSLLNSLSDIHGLNVSFSVLVFWWLTFLKDFWLVSQFHSLLLPKSLPIRKFWLRT